MSTAVPRVRAPEFAELGNLIQDLSEIWIGDADFCASLEVICCYGLKMTGAQSACAWLLEGAGMREAAQAGEPCRSETQALPTLDSDHPAARTVRSSKPELAPCPSGNGQGLAVPILTDHRVLGALVFSRTGVSFGPDDVARAVVLARQAAFAFRMRRRARELELVYEVTRAINSSLNLDEVIEFIHQGISRILPTDNFYIAFYDQEAGEIRFAIEIEDRRRKPPRRRPAAAGLTEYLLRTKRPLLIPNDFVSTCERLGIHFRGRASSCWMGAPMVFRDRAVGVIAIQSYERENLFDADHLSVLENLASQAAIAIENARLYQEVSNSYQNMQAAQQRLLQSEKLAAVGQLISGIAHELNNPLTGVVGWTQYLLGQKLPAEARRHLTTINAQAQRASKIVQNLLTFSRQHKPEKCAVSVNDVVESTLALRTYELKVNNIQVHRHYAPDLGPIHADPHQLQQVLLNLIINAEQAMLNHRHSGNLYLRTDACDGCVQIGIGDDGPGIEPELLKKIFDPFFTTKPLGQGTGLGLSISYGIIQEHGGRIWVESEPGRGASFYIALPLDSFAAGAALEATSATPAPEPNRQRVLIVDDEESVRDLLSAILEDQNVTVETACTGEEGFDKASGSSYDLVITDLKMPGLGGGKFYDRLSTTMGGRTPQFIFMTGDVLGADTQQLLERTHSLCLLKPFDIRQAKDLIQKGLAAASEKR